MTYRWAYMRQNFDTTMSESKPTDTEFVAWLNDHGKQGWELVSHDEKAVGWPEPGVCRYRYYCLFKRCAAVADPMARVA